MSYSKGCGVVRFWSESQSVFTIGFQKRSSPKFGNCFLQLIIFTALKLLTLPKFSILLPEKLWFCPNILLPLPEKFEFCPNLAKFEFYQILAIAPLHPGRYGYETQKQVCVYVLNIFRKTVSFLALNLKLIKNGFRFKSTKKGIFF